MRHIVRQAYTWGISRSGLHGPVIDLPPPPSHLRWQITPSSFEVHAPLSHLAPPLPAGTRVFLAGQSYSGHYLPLLAAELLRLDLVGRGPGQVDVRGLVPVNAWSDTLHDNTAAVEWWFSQGLISARVRTQLLNPRRAVYTGSPGTLCQPLLHMHACSPLLPYLDSPHSLLGGGAEPRGPPLRI